MKFVMRFVGCLVILGGLAKMAELATRPVPPVESCGSVRVQHLTPEEAWPLLPSFAEWVGQMMSSKQDRFGFHADMPMCRYAEERGCWEPLMVEQHVCTASDPPLH